MSKREGCSESNTPASGSKYRLKLMRGRYFIYLDKWNVKIAQFADAIEETEAERIVAAANAAVAQSERTAIGLFWQTADGKWHFSPGSTDRGDIHDNGRPIHIAYLGEEAPK